VGLSFFYNYNCSDSLWHITRHSTLELCRPNLKHVINRSFDHPPSGEGKRLAYPRALDSPALQTKVPNNFEIFLLAAPPTLRLHWPLYVTSLLFDRMTKLLITAVRGLGREDLWTSQLRPSKGVVASPALLDELLLYSTVKFKIFGSSIPHLLSVLTADKWLPVLCPVQLSPAYTASLN
jgi:hypothetical protein